MIATKRNYTTIDKEVLFMVYVINKFHHYIIGYQVFVYIDHVAIHYLMNKTMVSGRIIRWLFLLQEINVTIFDKPDKANVVANYLSRLTMR